MKLPVFKAFFASLSFFAVHFLTLLRILWLPALAMMAVTVFVMPGMLEAQMQIGAMEQSEDPAEIFSALGPMFQSMGVMYLATFIFYPMMVAGALRYIVNGDAPRAPFYLRFWGDELRVILAAIVLIVIFPLAYIVGILGVLAIGFAAMAISQVVGGILIFILMLAFMIALIWFGLRMSVVFPAVIGARSVGVAESWSLTKGNAWRLFFYWLLTGAVFMAFVVIYAFIAVSGYFSLLVEMITVAANDPEAAAEIEQRILEQQMAMWDKSSPGFWLYIGGTYLYTIISTALWAVFSGGAYRYLAGEE